MIPDDDAYRRLLERDDEVGQRLREGEVRELVAETMPVPACPPWCGDDPGHNYTCVADDHPSRWHEATIGRQVDDEDDMEIRVYLSAWEHGRFESQTVTVNPVRVEVEIDRCRSFVVTDPSKILELADVLRVAAQRLADAQA